MRDAAGFLEDAASCKVFWETAVLPPRPAPDADLMVSGASSVTRARLSGAGAVAPWGSFYTGSTDRAGEHFLVYTWWLLPDTKPLLSRGSLALPPPLPGPHLGQPSAHPKSSAICARPGTNSSLAGSDSSPHLKFQGPRHSGMEYALAKTVLLSATVCIV